ncbi:MAG: hypothetical protein ACRCZB_01810 [Bacteroidales bacterium]
MKKKRFFDRILQLAECYEIKSINKFAKEYLGYSSSERINRLREEGNNPSFEIIEDIANKFEEINMRWLITGEGAMLREVPTKEEGNNEMWELIKSQQETIRELSKKIPATPAYTPTNVKPTNRKVG